MLEYTAEQTDARLKYLDDARRFFVQVWRENPDLLKDGDPKIIEMMTPLWERDATAKAKMAFSTKHETSQIGNE